MTIKEKIVEILNESNELSIKEMIQATGASRQMVHQVVNQLLENGTISKLGRAPKTIYRLKN